MPAHRIIDRVTAGSLADMKELGCQAVVFDLDDCVETS